MHIDEVMHRNKYLKISISYMYLKISISYIPLYFV